MASSKAVFSILSLVFVLFALSDAKYIPRRVFQVGGKEHQWKIPSDSNIFDLWAQRTRFHVNDTLSFKYDAGKDSVVVVTREDYYNCDGSKPIEKYEGGDTMILLDRSGPFFFISGAEGHCEKGQRVVVVVMSPNHDWRIRPRSFAAPPVVSEEPSQAPARAPGVAGESGGAGGLTGGLGGVVAVGLVLVGMVVF